MSNSSFSTNSKDHSSTNVSINSTSSIGTIGAKMRRLKIQEDLIFQGIRKFQVVNNSESEERDSVDVHIYEYHNFTRSLKSTFLKIKNLFEDVKAVTLSKDLLKSEDINDVKDNVLELENSIRSFKKHLQKELVILKLAEVDLVTEMDESTDGNDKIKRLIKVPTTPYNEIVPSPVRILMNSPFKSKEVQEFHEFMKKGPNRYGGWNEYNHHIFVKFWHKYYTVSDCEHPDDPNKFVPLCHDLYQNIQGLTRDDIMMHNKWYFKYIDLKHRQDLAINKWKLNKAKLKKLPSKDKMATKSTVNSNSFKKSLNTSISSLNKFDDLSHFNGQINSELMECFGREHGNELLSNYANEKKFSKQQTRIPFQYLKPTKQWVNRCNGPIEDQRVYRLDDTTKRRIPNWRLGLIMQDVTEATGCKLKDFEY